MLGAKKKTKHVSVSFAGNDEVITHIIPDGRGRKAKSQSSILKQNYVDEKSDNESDEEQEVIKPASALVGEDDDVFGSQVYGFKTPKKSGQMALKASSSAKPVTLKTPKSAGRGKAPQTPKSILKKRESILEASGQTPVGRRAQKRLHKLNAQTPHRLRARNKKVEVSSESEDSASSASDWEDDNSSTYSGPTVPPASPTSTPQISGNDVTTTPSRQKGRRRKDKDTAVESECVESYFEAQSVKAPTSDHTLARLETPRMDQEQLNEALKDVEVGYKRERKALKQDYQDCFNKWMYLMCNSYNILMHGLGSKRELIEEFRCQKLAGFSHIVVNGFFPSLTIKSILNAISDDILGQKSNFRSVLDQCEHIADHFSSTDYEDFYIIIHNIDGSMLRSEKAQNVLSLLAQIRGVHIIASIDHINAPLIWDQTKASRFQWIWNDVTTFDAYVEETSYENSLLVQQSGVLALSSLTHVMRSLTPNAKGIFLLLVKYQLENKDQNYQGLAFPDLYQKCREAFLVNSDLTLRSQLTEFKDHKLIRSKKGIDGVEYLVIPLDEATLNEFISQQADDM